MKKLLFASVLSFAVFALCGGEAPAGLFHCCSCSQYSTFISIRPYNAFSPVCCGSLVCQGCNPLSICPGPMAMPPAPMCGPDGACCGGVPGMFAGFGPPSSCASGCCDQGCLPPPGSVPSMAPPPMAGMPPYGAQPLPPGGQPPVINAPPAFTPPMPTPLPSLSYLNTPRYPPVQAVGYWYGYPRNYYPGYAPAYGPVSGYYPWMAPASSAPGYWYGSQQSNYGR